MGEHPRRPRRRRGFSISTMPWSSPPPCLPRISSPEHRARSNRSPLTWGTLPRTSTPTSKVRREHIAVTTQIVATDTMAKMAEMAERDPGVGQEVANANTVAAARGVRPVAGAGMDGIGCTPTRVVRWHDALSGTPRSSSLSARHARDARRRTRRQRWWWRRFDVSTSVRETLTHHDSVDHLKIRERKTAAAH